MTPNQALHVLRAQSPLVHCITNYVAMNTAANVLLAAGASPAMIHAQEEVSAFAPIAGALTINIGTLSAPWLAAMKAAAGAAQNASVPWVLDPVAHFATPFRAKAAQDLLHLKPSIIRGNASEIIALSGGTGAGKGADAGDAVEDAEACAITLAQRLGSVVAVSGPIDFITDGTRSATITGGCAIMPKITALGCALTALTGGYAAITAPLEATVAAFAHFAEAGERAGQGAKGPGSFWISFLDTLAALEPGDIEEARITWR